MDCGHDGSFKATTVTDGFELNPVRSLNCFLIEHHDCLSSSSSRHMLT